MNKIVFVFVALLSVVSTCFSQDTITLRTKEEIQSKVVEITASEVKYKKFDNLNGPLFVIYKSDVLSIRYENGTKDEFNVEAVKEIAPLPNPVPSTAPAPAMSSNDYYMKGQKDATRYYYKYTGAGGGTLAASLLSPLLGLAPAIACSSTQPKELNMNYPDRELIKNPDYHRGYDLRAKKIKSNKVWTNWGVGFGVNLVLFLMISAQQ